MSAITGFRISPQQAAVWRLRHDRADHAYWSVLQLAIDGAVDEALIARRLESLGAREEILRTHLHALPGMAQPIQVIGKRAALPLAIEDLRALPAADQARMLASWREPAANEVSLDAVLARLDSSRFVLTLRAPAWAADSASLRLVAAALLAPPDAGAGLPAEEPLQYADYAEWKHDIVAAEPAHAGALYWRQYQADAGIPESLGLERPRSTWAGALAPAAMELDWSSADALAGLATRLGCTLEELLFASWVTLLGRLSGHGTMHVACVSASRGAGLDAAIGAYAQALPVRAPVDPARSLPAQLDDILAARRQAVVWQDAYDSSVDLAYAMAFHEPLVLAAPQPVTVLHESSVGQRFAVCLECSLELDCASSSLDAPAAGDEPAGSDTPAAGRARLRCGLAYDRSAIDETAVACLAEQWQLFLDGLVRSCDQAVGCIALLGSIQRRLIAPAAPEPDIEPVDIVTLIERQAARTPRAPATADAATTLDYETLDRQANQLAQYLVQQGVKPGDVVGILLPRGHEMVIALLAVLKAGAAYLPLDPGYPADRLGYMVQDSAAAHVITTSVHAALVSAEPAGAAEPAVLRLDALAPELAALPADRLASDRQHRDLEQPAYLIYTSGSTGEPKAVEVSHRNLSHSTQVRMAWYPTPVRAYLLLSSFSFDSSVAGIFWTLAQGGTLVLPGSGDELALDTLTDLIQQHRVSHGLSLPSLYQALLDFAGPDRLASLDTWIVAGEACKDEVVQTHRARLPAVRLVNEYGPTEATVWATADVLDQDSTATGVSIGRPIPTMGLWLLNEWGVPAAIGEPGEIHLGGPSLTRGYRGKPAQTAEVFVCRPDIADGQRVYRTGDLARWRVDGRLAFLGRRDHQVKIRGHRVELAEIERHLGLHEQVREAAVVAQEHAGSTRLVAYVIGAGGSAPDAGALRSYLSERLPAYMLPGAFVRLGRLPRSPNGKLDVNALPAPDSADQDQGRYVAPRSPLEEQLAAICAEVLRLPRVSVDDDFFQIGGDSILSLQVVTRASQRGIQLTAKQVFDNATVAAMAAVAVCREASHTVLDTHWQQSIDDPRALEAMALAAARYHMDALEVCAAVLIRCLATDRGRLRLVWVQDAGTDADANVYADAASTYVTRHELHCDSDDWPVALQTARTGLRQLASDSDTAADVSVRLASPGAAGPHAPADAAGHAPLHLSVLVAPDRLVLSWSADGRQIAAHALRATAERFVGELRALSEHCTTAEEQALSAMDFPSAGLDEDALHDLLTELADTGASQPE